MCKDTHTYSTNLYTHTNMEPKGNEGKAAEIAAFLCSLGGLLQKAILETMQINRSVNGFFHFAIFLKSMALNVLEGKGNGISTTGKRVGVCGFCSIVSDYFIPKIQ